MFIVFDCMVWGNDLNAITKRCAKMSPIKMPTSAAITILVEIVCEIYSIAIMSINAIADAITAAIIADCTEIWKKYKPVTTAEVIINKKRIIAIMDVLTPLYILK